MKRKPLTTTRPTKPREVRKKAVPFDRHAALPKAIDNGVFTAQPGSRVHAWRVRSGERPQWHVCEVVRVAPRYVELWDTTLGQWFCFDPTSPACPDIRMEGPAPVKPPTAGV